MDKKQAYQELISDVKEYYKAQELFQSLTLIR